MFRNIRRTFMKLQLMMELDGIVPSCQSSTDIWGSEEGHKQQNGLWRRLYLRDSSATLPLPAQNSEMF